MRASRRKRSRWSSLSALRTLRATCRLQARVHGQVHRAHAALSEHPADLVVADVGGQLGHGGTRATAPLQG